MPRTIPADELGARGARLASIEALERLAAEQHSADDPELAAGLAVLAASCGEARAELLEWLRWTGAQALREQRP